MCGLVHISFLQLLLYRHTMSLTQGIMVEERTNYQARSRQKNTGLIATHVVPVHTVNKEGANVSLSCLLELREVLEQPILSLEDDCRLRSTA